MEELKKVIEEIKQLNEDIKQATLGTGEYKNISDEKISKILLKLEAQLVKLEADKERWFKLVEDEKRKGTSINSSVILPKDTVINVGIAEPIIIYFNTSNA